MRVGIFDSGLGGLTVLKTLLAKYPNNEYIYYGDTLNIPYGDKTKEELLILARNNIEFLLDKHVSIIIVACGTVSSNCLDIIKKEYDIPIYSVLEPTFDYLNNSSYKNILVIATHATINSHLFSKCVNKNIYELETPKLVPLIENNDYSHLNEVLHEYLDDYVNKIDLLVLGCTHYPIIKDKIEEIIKVPLLDMGEYIEISNNGEASLTLYFSKIDEKIRNNVKKILDIKNIKIKLK